MSLSFTLYICLDVFERWVQEKIMDITDVFENKDMMRRSYHSNGHRYPTVECH